MCRKMQIVQLSLPVREANAARCCARATPVLAGEARSALFPSFARMMERMCRVLWETGDSTMSVITNKLIFDLIKQHYCPYASRGFTAYQVGNFRNPHSPDSVSAQAWDLGAQAAMLYEGATA